jgi:hypothetical protein
MSWSIGPAPAESPVSSTRRIAARAKSSRQSIPLRGESTEFFFLRLVEGMVMSWSILTVRGMAALAVLTWTAAARAGDPEQRGPNSDVATATLDSESTAQTVLVGHRGGFSFRHSSAGLSHSSAGFSIGRFHQIDNRFRFRRFDPIEDRLEAQFRRSNPFLFRRFDRIEDRLEAQLRHANPLRFRQFDRIEDRLEAQFRRANPFLFRRFDRIEDRLENRLGAPMARPARLAFPAFGDRGPTARVPAVTPRTTWPVTPPAAPRKLVYRAYGE